MMAKSPTRVALIAVAKDEAAYLPDWVHHHLHFGFSDIWIGVNRTSDTSAQILSAIAAQYPQVRFFDMDWIDAPGGGATHRNVALQPIAYRHMLDELRLACPDAHHALFLDIDEFWFPVDFETRVSDWLDGQPCFDTLSVHWMCQFGEEKPFAMPFEGARGRVRTQVKSFVNLRSDCLLKEVRPHSPVFSPAEQVVHIDVTGAAFLPHQGHRSLVRPAPGHSAYILHRMMRSRAEFKALMMRGNADDHLPFKRNREAFHLRPNLPDIVLPRPRMTAYHDSLKEFIRRCGLSCALAAARDRLLAVAKDYPTPSKVSFFADLERSFQVMEMVGEATRFDDRVAAYGPMTEAEKSSLQQFRAKRAVAEADAAT